METGEHGQHTLAAQQHVEEDFRSGLGSVTIQHLVLVGDLVKETFKQSSFAMSRIFVLEVFKGRLLIFFGGSQPPFKSFWSMFLFRYWAQKSIECCEAKCV